jgi:exopolyphosphatase/pppGpp-phosphohydrolase
MDALAAALLDAERCVALDGHPRPRVILACGGSARSVRKLVGPIVTADDLEAALEATSTRRGGSRKRMGRRRALTAGILLLQAVQTQLGGPLVIAEGGLREGVLLQLAGMAPDHWDLPAPSRLVTALPAGA